MKAATTRLRTWGTILRISVEERLVYRADFAVATLMRFIPIITQIFLWHAIFSASSHDRIAGFSRDSIVAYYLLVMISRALSSMPNLASGVALQIRDGEIKKFLVQPIDLIGFLLLTRVAHKLVYYVVALLPFALVFYLCRGYFPGWPPAAQMTAYLLSLMLAFLLGFFLEAIIGMVGFWFLEVSSLLFIYMMLNFILSGHMFPLDMLPGPLETAVKLLPLWYLAGFPAEVFLGRITGPELAWSLAGQIGWVVGLAALCQATYHLGVRRYSGFGG